MASDASVTDQTVNEQIETNVFDDLKNADEASLSKPEDLREKDGGAKVKVEDTAKSAEAPTSEPEEKVEQKEGCTVIEELKEEGNVTSVSEPSVEAEEKERKDETDVPNTPELSTEPVAQPAEVLGSSITEDSVKTPQEPALSEVLTEELAKGVEDSSEVSAVTSSPLVTDDKPVEPSTVCVIQEPTPDATTTTLDANGTAENSPDGEPTSDGVEVIPDSSKEELPPNQTSDLVIESPINEVYKTTESESSDAIVLVSVNEPREVEEATVVPEVPSEKIDDGHNADSGTNQSAEEEIVSATSVVEASDDTTPTSTEVAERMVEPEFNVKMDKQENTVDIVETALSKTARTIAENEVAGVSEEEKSSEGVEAIGQVKNESLEGDKLTLTATSRDITLVGVENEACSKDQECDSKESETELKPVVKQTLLDKFVNESAEDKKQETLQVDDQSLAETTKDDGARKTYGEAPKAAEISGKKSKNIISKMKQSIVKMKKAIIGKSPSSKTMAPEGIEGIDVSKAK